MASGVVPRPRVLNWHSVHELPTAKVSIGINVLASVGSVMAPTMS